MHLLFNEDCLTGMARLDDHSIDMVLADPPYQTTHNSWDSLIDLDELWRQLKRVCKPCAAVVMTAAQPFTTKLIGSNLRDFKYCWYWRKNIATGFLNAKKQPLRAMEDVVVFYRKPPVYNPQMVDGEPYFTNPKGNHTPNYNPFHRVPTNCDGKRYPRNLLTINTERGLHPTQKPVALCEYLIQTYTNEGQTVLDFCFGSGTCAVAAQNLGRGFVGFETSAEYFAIAQERLQNSKCG